MTTRINPTFLLKGVDPNKLLEAYQAGFFNRPIPVKAKIVMPRNTAILVPVYGTSNHEGVFCFKDKNNTSVIIATTGQENFQIYTKCGGMLVEGGRCDFCKKDFTNTVVGYPIAYKESTILVSKDNDYIYKNIYTFWVDGELCSFECALAKLRGLLSKQPDYQNNLIKDSESLLKMLYKLMHPDAEDLRASQCSRLLKENKGSLTREEWVDTKHLYINTNRVLLVPAKLEYMQEILPNSVKTIDYYRDIVKTI